ncbi:hypothetical protein E3N88_21909 [Mikania micrantha]|uniref:Myb/SANT-like domain-containing protein n=1 Tax=Mikania micrantha TaxID=192012 RepID=A0A5N6NBH6_9ASTR|nr:hypothetical protein E3N88_21909 [Mikania micrantha]
MDQNLHNTVDCEISNKKNKTKIVWDDATFKEFINACIVELRKGNRPDTHFNKVGWMNIEKNMIEKTNKTFDKKQLKNKWDNMKKDWKLYDRLMRLETRIGRSRSLIDASPEWWEEKIKVDKDFAKFRDANLDIYETHYAQLFRDCVAVGDQTMNPLQFQHTSNPNEHEEVNLDDDEDIFNSFIGSSYGKRTKSRDATNRSTKSKTSSFEDKLDVVLDALTSKTTQNIALNNPYPTISDCMNIVITFPDFNEGSKNYSLALRVFIKKQNREAFMCPTTNEAKMEFLKLLMD